MLALHSWIIKTKYHERLDALDRTLHLLGIKPKADPANKINT